MTVRTLKEILTRLPQDWQVATEEENSFSIVEGIRMLDDKKVITIVKLKTNGDT